MIVQAKLGGADAVSFKLIKLIWLSRTTLIIDLNKYQKPANTNYLKSLISLVKKNIKN